GVQSMKPARAQDNHLSHIEQEIRAGKTTADFVVDYHPRLWAQGEAEWNYKNVGSLAWRIVHGELMDPTDPANDQEKYEFFYVAFLADDEEMYGRVDRFAQRFLWTMLAGHARKYGWDTQLPSSLLPYASGKYTPAHTADQYYADARAKVMSMSTVSRKDEWPWWICLEGAVGYDWLMGATYTNGDPVLSIQDQTFLQNVLMTSADYVKQHATGDEHFFITPEISNYLYCVVGLALYEPGRKNDPAYAATNAKALEYLSDFDTYWIGKIIPAMNKQGGDGGWHGGYEIMALNFDPLYSPASVLPWHIAPVLFAHYTATGLPIENSLYSTGFIKYAAEFQNYMIQPDGQYYPPLPQEGARMPWIAPMRMYSRRRFSQDAEEKKIGELGAWVRNKSPDWFVNYGSYDLFEQTMFEEKWVNPRSPDLLGYPDTRHFEHLGWVFHRENFSSTNSKAILFVCQPYCWSGLEPYAQNTFRIDYQGKLIEGMENTILIDGKGRRDISDFPTLSDGVNAYAPQSEWDIGPGIRSCQSNQYFDLIIGDATHAYPKSKVSKFLRGVVYLKDKHLLILFDKVVVANNTEKSWTIDPVSAPELVANGIYKISNGSGACFLRRMLPENMNIASQSTSKFQTTTSLASDSLLIHLFQISDAGQNLSSSRIVIDQAELFDASPNRAGIQIGEWKIYFEEDQISIENNALDVHLVSFSGHLKNNHIVLTWRTISETNNIGFEIERRSEADPFRLIGFVKGQGNGQAGYRYEFVDTTFESGNTYYYRLKQINQDGTFQYSPTVRMDIAAPQELTLYQNYPNPFNPGTSIYYALPATSMVDLSVYDLNGRHVVTLINNIQQAGPHDIHWDGEDENGNNVAGGVYLYRLKSGNQTKSKKMVLVR
ncbi:T9SS type A sorting domain-containing protein, partial [candidate division KSB1 bacterium]|nr:T9SS type A sorting domain-containing protein [candidate division KSB1 bacterium]